MSGLILLGTFEVAVTVDLRPQFLEDAKKRNDPFLPQLRVLFQDPGFSIQGEETFVVGILKAPALGKKERTITRIMEEALGEGYGILSPKVILPLVRSLNGAFPARPAFKEANDVRVYHEPFMCGGNPRMFSLIRRGYGWIPETCHFGHDVLVPKEQGFAFLKVT